MKKTFEQEHNELISKLETNLGTKIKSVQFAELRASSDAYKLMNLKLSFGKTSLFGVLAFTEKGLFYYIPATQASYLGFVKKMDEDEMKDQIFDFSTCSEVKFNVSRKTFFSFLVPEEKRTLYCSAKFNEKDLNLIFIVNGNAEELLPELNK